MRLEHQIDQACQNNKRPLVLFSGGMDSTSLISWFLHFTNVDVFYVQANVHPWKQQKEKEARELIKARFAEQRKTSDIHRIVDDFELEMNGLYAQTHNYSLVQPISWLTAALIKFNPTVHSGVAVGYLLGDQAPAFRKELEDFWRAGWVLLRGRGMEPPPVWFPLLDFGNTKKNIVEMLDLDLRKLCWVCETPKLKPSHRKYPDDKVPNKQIIACGTCMPCTTLKNQIDNGREAGKWTNYYEVPTDEKVCEKAD
jgi:hypothetical protein